MARCDHQPPLVSQTPLEAICSKSILLDGSGTDLIREMREANPALQVLALTIVQSPKTLSEAQEMGIEGVVSKAAQMEETLGAIRRLAEKEQARTR